MEIFKLFGRILIDNEDANRKIDETDAKAGKVGRTLSSVVATAAKWGAGIAAAAGAGVAALGGLVSRATQAATEVVKLSQTTGFSTRGFQEWDHVMQQFGWSMGQASNNLANFQERIMQASQGSGEAAAAFQELGVQVVDSSGRLRSSEAVFEDTIRALQQMEDVTRRNALASQLLGNTAEEIAPVLNMTAEELASLRASAHVISDEDLRRADQFATVWGTVKTALSTLVIDLGLRFLPTVERAVSYAAEHVPKIGPVFEFVAEVVSIVLKYLRLMVSDAFTWMRNNVIDPFTEWMITVWQERGPPIVEAVQALWDGIKAVFTAVFETLRGLWDAFALAFQGEWEGAWTKVKEVFVDLWNQLPDLFTGILNPLIDLADQIMQAIIDVIRSLFGDQVAGIFETAWDAVKAVFEGARDILLGIWTALTAAVRGDWDAAWAAILGVVETAFSTIETVISAAFTIIDTIVDGSLNVIVALFRVILGDDAAAAVDTAFEAIRIIVDTASQAVLGIIRAIMALVQGDWETAWEEVKNVAATIWNALPAIFESAITGLIGIADVVMTAVIGVIRDVFGDRVADHFQAVWDAVKGVFEAAKDLLIAIWTALTAIFQQDWVDAWEAIKTVPETALTTVIGLVEASLNALTDLVDWMLKGIVELFRLIFDDEIAAHVERGFEVVRTVIESAQELILGVLRAFLSLIRGDWEAAWEGILETFQSIWGRFSDLFAAPLETAVRSIVDFVMRLINTLRVGKDLVIQRAREMAQGIAEWFGETRIGKTFSWLGDQIETVGGWFYSLYDRVVGHSYIPDMVEEIGQAIERLREKLRNPVVRYTTEALQAFENLSEGAITAAIAIAEGWDRALKSAGDTIAGWISQTTFDLVNGVKTWETIFSDFGNVTKSILESIFSEIVKQLVANIIAQNTWLASTLANISTAIAAFVSQAYAALVGFFWFLGPGAPAAAAAVIAGVVAAVAQYAGQAFRSMFGGGAPVPSVPGSGEIPGGGGGRSPSAGRQIAEITGPTRDLLTDLLSPLASLNTLTGIGERIYHLLDERLPSPAMMLAGAGATAAVGGISVFVERGAVQLITTGGTEVELDDDTLDEIAGRLAEKIGFALRGTGRD